ncbi:MAG: immunoglobulin domain-containing protein [Planctomycetota bacterium]
MSRSLAVRLAALLFALLARPSTAAAQCLDFAAGFELGAHSPGGTVVDLAEWNDGGGARLALAGGFPGPIPGATYGVALWDGATLTKLGVTQNGAGAGNVNSVAVFDDGTGPALYLGGLFQSVDGVAAAGVAKWNGTSWSPLGAGIVGTVNRLRAADDGTGTALFATGSFDLAGGGAAAKIAKWNGSAWSALGSGLDAQGFALLGADLGAGPRLLVGGAFSFAGGVTALRVAAWNGSSWSSVAPLSPTSDVRAMAVFNGALYVGGNASSSFFRRLAGTTWQSPSPQPNGMVRTLTVHDDGSGPALYLGGDFLNVGTSPYVHAARWDGAQYSGLGLGLGNSSVGHAFASSSTDLGAGPALFFGGDFGTAGGKPSADLALWGVPCTAPNVVQGPADVTAVFPNDARFHVVADGTQPITYQWRHNGAPLANGSGVEGATTADLRLATWDYGDAGSYDCELTNALGSTTSPSAQFTVPLLVPAGIPAQVTTVVRPGDAVSDLPPGNAYTSVFDAQMTRTGGVLCRSTINGTNFPALSLGLPPGVQTLHRTGDAAPGLGTGVTYAGTTIGDATIAGTDVVAFGRDVIGPGINSSNNWGVWVHDAQGTALILQKGAALPFGNPGDVVRSMPSPNAEASGRATFRAEVWNGSTFAYSGILAYDRVNGLQRLVRRGDLAPGTSAHYLDVDAPVADPQGRLVFTSSLDTHTGYNVTGSYDRAVHVLDGGVLQTIAKSGDPAPGFAANVNLEFIDGAIVDDAGTVYFDTLVAGPSGYLSKACYTWSGGPLLPLVLPGDPAPGLSVGATFATGEPIAASAGGRLVFAADVFDNCGLPSCPTRGVFARTPTGMHAVITNHADPLPAAPAFHVLEVLQSAAINASGEVLVQVLLTNSREALYGWTEASGLFPIAVPGMQYEFAPGVYGTVGRALLGGNVSGNALPAPALDDAGEFVFRVTMMDGATNVLVKGTFTHFLALSHPCPTIVSSPSSRSVVTGTPVTLHAAGAGLEPLARQWFKDGLAVVDGGGITGATTDTLAIASTVESDTGAYTCELANACGTATTTPALLTVGPGTLFCTGDGLDASVTTSCPCQNFGGEAHGCANSVNATGATLRATGATNPDDVVLQGSGMPNTASAIYLKGDADNGAGVVFGDGVRCVDGSLIRLRTKQNAGGASQFPEVGEPSVSVRGQTPSGSGLTGYYQVYYRNSAAAFCPPATFNVTNGLRIDW